ncbi:nitrogenase molybdenum-iron cofactor biosynthesis protein NifB/NifX-related protein [Geotalea daltonii FRC-32]|uniref:Nitrogenase molybdenum-iron cofactor biosynthesis protein NifB/NifX-related protein n=1 Tax=Geotalea daltonii (strain DSM 22248 / JCM 15807 / FRC-32) TaxID=316067 RepID=B9M070_GEODF|nr:NifB/NifX family molybdenum-iron cluster-binding protein [Geotalea daltonii]ACM20850.1 nitrogenase molybdenum-iron cofactor biosynthesis protein NifB/NifX-related protein [Geotalea daltonii FRC-32]
MIRVAIASSDGESINEHFGKASQFIIYEVEDDGNYRQVEKREVLSGCSNAETSVHGPGGTTDRLGDVQAVFAVQIGPGAAAALQEKGVRAFNLKGSVHKALTAYGKRRKLLDAKIAGLTQGCGSGGGCGCGGSGGNSCR